MLWFNRHQVLTSLLTWWCIRPARRPCRRPPRAARPCSQHRPRPSSTCLHTPSPSQNFSLCSNKSSSKRDVISIQVTLSITWCPVLSCIHASCSTGSERGVQIVEGGHLSFSLSKRELVGDVAALLTSKGIRVSIMLRKCQHGNFEG